ncbi:hypothetical protein P43SY_007362 [Pythium insidiosum]|uniref:TNFR-Cys domain-containing protein n=1 Tax=Pythium insidiosum TaxID=114742 RepID=A0AAD5Q9T3_PYTIN|nr:hypothetical protein P43SY_007362 [Pythium insidiosum]
MRGLVLCLAATMWSAEQAMVEVPAGSIGEVQQILASFLDMDDLIKTMTDIVKLSQQAFGPDALPSNVTLPPFDGRFPLADYDLGLLLQLYAKCGSPSSDALATWCTGLTADGTWFAAEPNSDEHLRVCPPGVRTHPCTGRVLGVPKDHVEYLWPWEGIRCEVLTDPTTVTHVYLPDEGLSCRLEELDFSQMVSLQQLDLSRNNLTGPMPSWLGNFMVLRHLNLRENQLEGPLPITLAENADLEVLDVAHNRLSAISLASFNIFTRLRDLAANEFDLELPTDFFKGDYLEHVYVSGLYAFEWLGDGALSGMIDSNLSYNSFRGLLPKPPFQKNVVVFDVSNNAFEGELPVEIENWGREDVNDDEDKSILEAFLLHNLTARLEKNSFLCPLPPISPNATFFGGLTCRCANGRSLRTNTSTHRFLDSVIPAAQASQLCSVCPRGAYSNSTTGHKCTLCPRGFISREHDDRPGADSCAPCQAGTFANETGRDQCLSCPPGSFAATEGQATCELCPPGLIAPRDGSSKCQPCGIGRFSPVDGGTACLPCPKGTFAPSVGELECLDCPTGYFQDNEGQGSCRVCPPGHVAPSPGHWRCQPCAEGSYHVPETKSCELCPPNSFTRSVGQTQCTPCPQGQIAQGFGNTKCSTRVAPGSGWSAGTATTKTTTLTSCAPGMFNNGSYLSCQPCPPGRFSANSGASACAPCPRGFYSDEAGAVGCKPAPAGTFVGEEGAWRPTSCPSGTFSNVTTGAQTCSLCPPMTARLEAGGTTCLPPNEGEILRIVRWQRVQWSLLGVRYHDVMNETLQRQLLTGWKNALVGHGARDVIPHLIETQRARPNADAVVLILAMEKVPAEQPKRRPKSSEDVFMKIKGTLESMQRTYVDAKETVTQWVDKVTHNDKNKGVDYSRLKPTNVSEVLSNTSGFDASLALQLERSNALSVSTRMMRIRLLSEPLHALHAKPCPKGSFLVNTTTPLGRTCQPCPVGHFSDTEGAMQCRRCERGYFSDQEGLAACWRCPWGKGAAPGASACHECSFLSRDCQSFGDNVVAVLALAFTAAVTLWRRMRAATRGAEWSQQRAECVALVASVRIHGRVPSASAARAVNAFTAEMDSVPLFEREHRKDSQLVQRLQNELADAKRFLEAQARRQNDLEYVNEDLERRLEQEALDRIALDAQKAEDERRWMQERAALEEQRAMWEKRFEEESRRRAIVEERLRRAEKELYRMHQKKYDIEKAVRREENEKRKHEAQIVRSLELDSQNAARRAQQASSSHGFLNIDPTVNPKDTKPATVRTRQALSSALDFFGI